jgi:hypothetical protein
VLSQSDQPELHVKEHVPPVIVQLQVPMQSGGEPHDDDLDCVQPLETPAFALAVHVAEEQADGRQIEGLGMQSQLPEVAFPVPHVVVNETDAYVLTDIMLKTTNKRKIFFISTHLYWLW